jgi:DNA-binding NtrC family response regulator
LRVLQEHEVTPVGATRPVAVDLRVVAATNRDLEREIATATFRADLFARLSGHSLVLPPLRARREDLGPLIAVLLRELAPDRASEVTFSGETMRALLRHGWPLNIRELQQCLASALAVSGGARIEVQHLPSAVRAGATTVAGESVGPPEDPLSPDERRLKDELMALLEQHEGNVSAVARAMGKARMQVQRWIKRYRLDRARFTR